MLLRSHRHLRRRIGSGRASAAGETPATRSLSSVARYTRLDVDERRRQLLDLGAGLFARFSYDELSMAKIAREAGISKALLYHYFPSKQAYFAATLEQAAAELAETPAAGPGLPPVEQLAASLDAYLAGSRRNADAYAKLITSVGAVPEVRELVERVRDETARAHPRRHSRPTAPRRRCAPPSAAGCGSWTARSSTGSSTATSTAQRLHGLLLGALLGAVTASGETDQSLTRSTTIARSSRWRSGSNAAHRLRRPRSRSPPPTRPRRRRPPRAGAPRRSARRPRRGRRPRRRCRGRACRPARA